MGAPRTTGRKDRSERGETGDGEGEDVKRQKKDVEDGNSGWDVVAEKHTGATA